MNSKTISVTLDGSDVLFLSVAIGFAVIVFLVFIIWLYERWTKQN